MDFILPLRFFNKLAGLGLGVMQLCFSITAQGAVIEREITINTQEWPPYQISKDTSHRGHAIEALDCVMQKLNQPYKVIFLPWGRAQLEVKQGKKDAFFSASQNSTRDEYAVLSNTFIEQVWNFYLPSDTPIKLNNTDIKENALFGSRRHSNTSYWLKKNGYNIIYQTTTLEEMLPKLMKGRVGAMMENKLLFNDALRRADISIDEFQVVPNMSMPLGVYFGKHFIKEHPEFLYEFNQHTEECRFKS